MTDPKVFLVTGASSGFGRAIARAALDAGHFVIGTIRREADRLGFEQLHPDRARAVILDVTAFDRIDDAVGGIVSEHGRIDVLVNSAGYGHEGLLEESSLDELRRQLDVNLFGAIAVTKAVLPFMRTQLRGHILNITSMAGYMGLAGISYYTASKYALEGVSDVLAKEVAPFGIKVTAVAPGSFRTDWAGRSMVRSERSIADYDALFDPIRQARQEKSGKQNGDPDRAAKVMVDLVEMADPPVHLLLGSDALGLVRRSLKTQLDDIARFEEITRSTDYE